MKNSYNGTILAGQLIGQWTVIEVPPHTNSRSQITVKCECGTVCSVVSHRLRSGQSVASRCAVGNAHAARRGNPQEDGIILLGNDLGRGLSLAMLLTPEN